MDISLLADKPHEAKQIARWYFDEWASKHPHVTIEHVLNNISKATNSTFAPLIVLSHEEETLVGVAELKIRENINFPDYEHWCIYYLKMVPSSI